MIPSAIERKDRKQEGRHDWSAACDPTTSNYSLQQSFSAGIFKWVKKASGKGLKRTEVIHRVIAPTHMVVPLYQRCEYLCDLMDTGHIPPFKSERLR